LITLTDSNNDYEYQQGEQIEHPVLSLKDNSVMDEKSLKDQILVKIYDIPNNQPPEKYGDLFIEIDLMCLTFHGNFSL
jgi:hypothetical protein